MEKKSWTSNLRHDLPAGLVVFLVALPLCLGIALASGVSLFSGMITGIIGGLVVGFLSGSQLSVSGPAAGLTVIILSALETLPSFEVFLAAVVFAGVIQLVLGFMRAGLIGYYFPTTVIKGMLAAIGLLLIFKQIPHLVGVDDEAFGLLSFKTVEGENTITLFIRSLSEFDRGALIIGVTAIVVMKLWDTKVGRRFKSLALIPGALIAVVLSVVMNLVFKRLLPDLAIGSTHLVNLPKIKDASDMMAALSFPDFSGSVTTEFWLITFTLAIVASLETLLSLEAVDNIDPMKRVSPTNRELKAQGVGNVLSGLIGGIPMTSVIVRSSANVSAGGRTKISAVFHGLLLLLALLIFPGVINLIPYSALAAILILVGLKLTKPALYQSMYRLGTDQFIPFMVTIIAILFTDLLIGIGIGMVVGIFFILKVNYQVPYFMRKEEVSDGERNRLKIQLSEHVSFLNKAALQKALLEIEDDTDVFIDGARTEKIDYDALEVLHNFRISSVGRGIEVVITDIPELSIFDGKGHSGG